MKGSIGVVNDPCRTDFDKWLSVYGRSRCNRVMREHLHKRLDVADRPERKRFPWGEYKRLYEQQRGRCGICKQTLALIRGLVEMDHINPNLTGEAFNARSNRQVVCVGCNRSKGALSIPAQAKRYGKPMAELLKREDVEDV